MENEGRSGMKNGGRDCMETGLRDGIKNGDRKCTQKRVLHRGVGLGYNSKPLLPVWADKRGEN